MSETMYDRLVTHLGQGELGQLPKSKELIDMLEILFTPVQVEFARHLPMDRYRRYKKGRIA